MWNPTFQHLCRRTLNDLQRNKHEKSCPSFLRVQDPSELALMPCTRYNQTYTHKHARTRAHAESNSKHPTVVRDTIWRGFFLWKTTNIDQLCPLRAPHQNKHIGELQECAIRKQIMALYQYTPTTGCSQLSMGFMLDVYYSWCRTQPAPHKAHLIYHHCTPLVTQTSCTAKTTGYAS